MVTTLVSSPVSLQATNKAMQELIIDGLQPNGKVAFWNAALSIRNFLSRNGKQASIMRTYANRPLPLNRDELKRELDLSLNTVLNTLYEIEKLWNCGLIHFNCGDTFDLQSKWRDAMCSLIHGMGMKTVSFALHIYAPNECLLLTIDCWHLRRLNSPSDSVPRKVYIQFESQLYYQIFELSQYEEAGYSPLVYAACLWERYRRLVGASKPNGAYPSHGPLTCYC